MTAGKLTEKIMRQAPSLKLGMVKMMLFVLGTLIKKRGYISGLSVYEAVAYAENNPGTQFIFATRDKVRYLNINEVNDLRNKNDALPINKNGFP